MFILTIWKETILKFSQGSVRVLWIVGHQEMRVKLSHTQINKLKYMAEKKTGTIIRIYKKIFEDEELLHELFLTTWQTTKIRHAFANNMSTDIKLIKAQISKAIKSFRSCLAKLGKIAITNVDFFLARKDLPGLVSNLILNATTKFGRKVSEKGALRARKELIFFVSN